MKTRLFSFILVLILSVPYALTQSTDEAKTSFAILLGVNFQNLNGKNSAGDKLKNDMLIGYHAGVNIQIPIVPQFYFQPGLLYSLKGAKYADASKVKISYLELPLNFVYKALLGKGYFFLGFGPYIGYAISGKAVPKSGSSISFKFKNKLTPEEQVDGNSYIKHLDAGANLFAGYELAGGIFLQLDTQFGMLKINPENQDNSGDKTAIRNTGFGLSLGYRF